MIPEHVSPDRFAAAVATRLNSVVPAGLSVRAEGSGVCLYDPESWGASWAADILTDDDGRSIVELVETAAYAIMNSIQDEVMESTKEQWPLGPRGAAEPEARVIGEQLHLWFGDAAAPILRLEPVQLVELADGAA
jgi:hypothetical protein